MLIKKQESSLDQFLVLFNTVFDQLLMAQEYCYTDFYIVVNSLVENGNLTEPIIFDVAGLSKYF